MIFKNGELTLAAEPYQNVVTSSIVFQSQDINTAKLIITLKKDDQPLPLSSVQAKLVFKTADGSIFKVDAEISDKINGIVSYVLNKDILSHDGRVTGELYLKYNNGQSLSAHRFTFNINKSIIDENVSMLAQYYISDFEDLKTSLLLSTNDISKKVDEIKEEIEKNNVIKTIADVKKATTQNSTQIGNLSELQTTEKSNIVKAINEIKATGGSGTGMTPQQVQDLNTAKTKSVDNEQKIADLSKSISNISSGAVKGAYATLTDLQTAKPTGDTNIYIVSADGKWYYWNGTAWTPGGIYQATAIADDSVTAKMAKFLAKSTNLFNRNKVTDGLLDYTTGNVNASTTDVVSEFIDALPNTYYGTYPSGQFAFYDKDKKFINGVTNTNFATNRKSPANAAYIRFGLTKTNLNWVGSSGEKAQLNASAVTFSGTPVYEEYYVRFTELTLKQENIPQEVLSYITTSIPTNSITPEKTSFMALKTNVIKLDSLLTLGSLDSTTGVISASTTEYVTSKINVKSFLNKFVVSSVPCKATVFDANDTVVGQFGNLNGVASRKIPSNARYIIVGMTVANFNGSVSQNGGTIIKFFDTAQTGVTLIPYEDTDPRLSNVKVPYSALADAPIEMEKIKLSAYDFYRTLFGSAICIGDSITEGYREAINATYKGKSYPVYLNRMTGWVVENAGVSGCTSTYWWANKAKTYTYTNYDVAIIKLGQNEGLTDTVVADTSVAGYENYANTNTGNYCKIIEYIKEKNPNIKIFLVSIQNASDTVTNGVIQQIAAKYTLPYLDISKNGVYNLTDNKYHYNGATYYGVHFNTIGYVTLAKVIYMMMMENINSNVVNYQNY